MLGVAANNAHRTRRKDAHAKRRVRAELQAKEFTAIHMQDQMRRAEIDVDCAMRLYQLKRNDKNFEDFKHRSQQAEKYKEKTIAAVSDLHKTLAEIMMLFAADGEVVRQCAKIMNLPPPPTEEIPDTLATAEGVITWGNGIKAGIVQYTRENVAGEYRILFSLLHGSGSRQAPADPELRIVTLLKGLWATFKD